MLESLRKRHDDEDEGFTLIELMVVVLIIAILLAIAIPTFLGARERAQNRAAQSDIRNALAAEKVFYTDEESYTGPVDAITSIEPSLEYSAAGDEDFVGLDVRDAQASGDDGAVCVSKQSKSGDEFSLLDVATGDNAGTYYYEDLVCDSEDGTATPTGDKTGW